MRIQEDKVFDAIMEEAKDMGLPKSFVALVSKMYSDQQEIGRCIEGLMRGNEWKEKLVEKRLDELEEKIDPEKAEKRKKEKGMCKSAAISCNLPNKGGVLG